MSSKAGNKSFDTEKEFTFEWLSIEWKCKASYTIEEIEIGQGSNRFKDVYDVAELEILSPDGYDVSNSITNLYAVSLATGAKVSMLAVFLAEAERLAPEL